MTAPFADQLHHDLQNLRAVFPSYAQWTKGAQARNRWGGGCDPIGEAAVCWCISGGVHKVLGVTTDFVLASNEALRMRYARMREAVLEVVNETRRERGDRVLMSLEGFNDHRATDYHELMAMLALAIERNPPTQDSKDV